MTISVIGAGAFGTAVAIALSKDGTPVSLWSRDKTDADDMQSSRQSGRRLPGFHLPDELNVTDNRAAFEADICLLAIPAQSLTEFMSNHTFAPASALVACAKGISRQTGLGPVATIKQAFPSSTAAILTGPSFAVDIASGLPTAIVLATQDAQDAKHLQDRLARPALRLYRSTDVIGAELGGALKNIVAIAAGMTIGAGLGDSARASIVARGLSELSRFAVAKGAEIETIQGLSGLGDLVLTCTSEKSRNFSAGIEIGQGKRPDGSRTVEGLATASVVADDAKTLGLDLPLIRATADVIAGRLDIAQAIEALLTRPVGME